MQRASKWLSILIDNVHSSFLTPTSSRVKLQYKKYPGRTDKLLTNNLHSSFAQHFSDLWDDTHYFAWTGRFVVNSALVTNVSWAIFRRPCHVKDDSTWVPCRDGDNGQDSNGQPSEWSPGGPKWFFRWSPTGVINRLISLLVYGYDKYFSWYSIWTLYNYSLTLLDIVCLLITMYSTYFNTSFFSVYFLEWNTNIIISILFNMIFICNKSPNIKHIPSLI